MNLSTAAAIIFDFDETIIDLEPQHTAAHAALCRDQGADYDDMPESFRRGSGRRIIDDIREMRVHFGWTASEEELFARRQEHFDAVCQAADLQAMEGVRETIDRLIAHQVNIVRHTVFRAQPPALGLKMEFNLCGEASFQLLFRKSFR